MKGRECPNSLAKISYKAKLLSAEARNNFNKTLLFLEQTNSTESDGDLSLSAEIFETTFNKPPCDDTISDDVSIFSIG